MKKMVSLFFLLAASSSTFASDTSDQQAVAPLQPPSKIAGSPDDSSFTLLNTVEYATVMGFTGFASNQFGWSPKQSGLLAVGAIGLLCLVKSGEASTNQRVKTWSGFAHRAINALPVLATVYKTASLPSVTNAFATRGGADSLTAIAAKTTVVGVGMVAGNHLLNKAITQKK